MEFLNALAQDQSALIFLAYLASAILLFLLTFFVLVKESSKSANVSFFISALCLVLFLLSRAFALASFGSSVIDWAFISKLLIFASFPFAIRTLLSSFNKTRLEDVVSYLTHVLCFGTILCLLFLPKELAEKMYYALFFNPFPSNIDIISTLLFFFVLFFLFCPAAYALIKRSYIDALLKKQFWCLWFFFLFFYFVTLFLVLPSSQFSTSLLPPALFGLTAPLLFLALLRYELFGVKLMSRHSLLPAFTVSLVISILVLVNFYAVTIQNFFGIFPSSVIPVASIVLAIIVGWTLWWRERRLDRSKFEFVNVVTHQFRNPLTYIKWSLQELRKEQTQTERTASLNQIEEGNERLVELVNILVGISKAEDSFSYVLSAVSPREIIEEALSQYALKMRQKQITLSISIGEDLPLLTADLNRLKLVIHILLENAMAYTPEHGSISVSVQRKEHSVLFAFRDTGIGISKEDMGNMFKNFYRTPEAQAADTTGMGLGLYIAKSIIERHGGKIWAESAGKGKGSTFYVELKFSGV
ncbi:MAG: HAMP domain-containing sensor histidine kinase [Candidatus Pacebacteria bacterium]|nr:HAMP domain-containing sensor histidine kinase [Candidatus Paceibacterota bacterium]MDD5357116.1 HAMP domain-containing sensor histidine kinase [Candidatus Paceibacterota bacterium]